MRLPTPCRPAALAAALACALALPAAQAQSLNLGAASVAWTYNHDSSNGFLSEIVAFDDSTQTLWVTGVSGVDVLSASTGALVQRIDTTAWGSINGLAIHGGLAAFAMEASTRSNPGTVLLYDTSTRALASGINTLTVGALPDMLTFTPDGSKLLVANEGTPDSYGIPVVDTNGHRNFAPGVSDPTGSISIIDMGSRSVLANAGFSGVPLSGSMIRTNTGMDFEPEYIAVNASGTTAWVTLQEANAVARLNLQTLSVDRVVGLGAKDFSAPGNAIDPSDRDGVVAFGSVNAKGLYMPDAIAAYDAGGQTFIVTANEGDFREDDGDRSRASTLGAAAPLNRLQVSNTDSTASELFVAGARSFSIRDADGNLVYDSGSILDEQAAALGIYNDGRSDDKGVEPEGVELLSVDGRTLAFIGLERTTQSAVGVFDITDPGNVSFLQMLVSPGDVSPEGLKAFQAGDGQWYLALSNEVTSTTSVFALSLAPVPEPTTWALMLAGLAGIGHIAARRRPR